MAGEQGQPRGPELESALRAALDDPTLVLLYRDTDDGWTDARGVTAPPPAADGHQAVTLLGSDGEPRVAVVHDVLLLDDPGVLPTLSAVVRLAVDNDRLQADLRTKLEEVRASRARVVEAADAERRRVEHDGAQQRLVALAVSPRTIRVRLGPDANPAALAEIDAAAGEARAAIEELRELARGLDPAILREAGLSAALQSLADRSPVPVRTDLRVEGRLPTRVETAAWFAASEALANVADGWLHLEIADNGAGGADPDGPGLRGLVDRIAAADGTLSVRTPPGGGTAVEVAIPCAS